MMRTYFSDELLRHLSDREHKQRLLALLDAFDKFCRDNNLRYYLSGGTLLGAVRHHGFIPWDDDVDVNMPRPDCERLMELSGGRIGDYLLEPPNYSYNYHAYHWKLYDEGVLVQKRKNSKVYPIFLDIFPIEGLPSTQAETVRHYNKLRRAKMWANLIWAGNTAFRNKNKFYKLAGLACMRYVEHVGADRLFGGVVDVQTSIPFDEADYVGVMSTNVHFEEERVVKADYMPVVRLPIGDKDYPAPQCYDTYLTQLFGNNYMQLLPVNERLPKHSLIPYEAKGPKDNEACFDLNSWHHYWCPKEPDIRIAICGLIRSDNIGELFIARSLEYLIGTLCREKIPDFSIDFTEVDLLGRVDETDVVLNRVLNKLRNYENFQVRGMAMDWASAKLKKLGRQTSNQKVSNAIFRFRNFIWSHSHNNRPRLEKFFDRRLKGTDFIVVDGAGLLEYSYNEYGWSLMLVSEYAQRHGLSVVYNAIGHVGAYDEQDYRSKTLQKALRSPCVKYISARDSTQIVQECAGATHNVELLADAAFWMRETYGVDPQPERKKIGIGLVRGNALQGYGIEYSRRNWVDLFVRIAELLDERGYEFEFFTDGLEGDIRVGNSVLKRLGLPNSYLVKRPADDLTLYRTISGYQAIISCRMHSSIAAFTLGIPAIVLSWNRKVEKLMDHIGYPKRAIPYKNFDATYIVDSMEQALAKGVSKKKVNAMKAKARRSVAAYVDLILEKAGYCESADKNIRQALTDGRIVDMGTTAVGTASKVDTARSVDSATEANIAASIGTAAGVSIAAGT